MKGKKIEVFFPLKWYFMQHKATVNYAIFFSGKFSFPAIISGLSNLLKDYDPNIRAVAAIALAKSGNLKQALCIEWFRP